VPWFYYMSRVILIIFFFLLTRRQVKGSENIPMQGPLLVVSNHLSLADPPLLGISLKRKMAFVAKNQLFRFWLLSWALRNLGAFPVHRGQQDRQALRQTYQVLADSRALIIFPEGMRSRNGHLRPAFFGAAQIASRSGAPILPVGISGTEKLEHLSWWWRRPQVTVNIGHPFSLPPLRSNMTKGERMEFTHSIMQHIAELLPVDYQGDYTHEN
jgi:1-acyl-sn-glycerol-3-phosphate acyltransferase